MAATFQFAQSTGGILNSGDAEAGSTATVINTSDTSGASAGNLLEMTDGGQAGRRRKIASITANVSITLDSAFPGAPSTGNLYVVFATTDIGAGGDNHFNFKNADTANPADYSSYPITAGASSYEVYLNAHWTGTFNAITTNKVWMSTYSMTGYGTGALVTASVVTNYAQPSTTANGDSETPTVEGSALDPTISEGTGTPDVGTAGYSKLWRMQLQTDSDATPGTGGTNVMTLKWSES